MKINALSKVMALGMLTVFSGCEIEQCDQKEPTFEFHQFEYIPADPTDAFSTDTLVLWTKFIDCQGDIGIEEGNNTKNLQTFLFEKKNGQWVKFEPVNPEDSVLLFAEIPYSNQVRDNQKAEGFIEQPMGSIRQSSDTIRFETRLIDRAGNKSEIVTTPEFVFPN